MEEDNGEYLADYFGDDWDVAASEQQQPPAHPAHNYDYYSAQDASLANSATATAAAAAIHAQYEQQNVPPPQPQPDDASSIAMEGCITSADLRPTDSLCGRGN